MVVADASGGCEAAQPYDAPLPDDLLDGFVGEAVREAFDRDYEITPTALPTGINTNGATRAAVPLPTGQGSIEGLGESFNVSLGTGGGSYAVPIVMPVGRASFQPHLRLAYSTATGQSVAGAGWALPSAFIQRQTDRGTPRYLDAPAWHPQEDRFVYNGGSELVPIDSSAATVDEGTVPAELAGWQQYRARLEGEFLRFFRSPDSRRWVVQSTDGLRFDFRCRSTSAAMRREGSHSPPTARRIRSAPPGSIGGAIPPLCVRAGSDRMIHDHAGGGPKTAKLVVEVVNGREPQSTCDYRAMSAQLMVLDSGIAIHSSSFTRNSLARSS